MEQIGSICTYGNFNINGVGKTINVKNITTMKLRVVKFINHDLKTL